VERRATMEATARNLIFSEARGRVGLTWIRLFKGFFCVCVESSGFRDEGKEC
jgi:hypothetical protein